ncbi:hypothetical protein O7632_10750 [Solwaraspora sp. WMMD406]|uniref:hypothetical protein n=1 Tax=Solwaraspora sp. WMMD406 TaxID=3016095 RepID=UPI002416F53D|nr:hypothetical protein [Solwaraspora sp. WMMD406]MDG4764577.1 hypothetical protein [Solwaraspora sp. WMMD406]
MAHVLVVGPRQLPEDSVVKVWIDSGSTGGGTIQVRRDRLTLAEIDSGEGSVAIYQMRTYD